MKGQELQEYYARQAQIINEQIQSQRVRAQYEALYYNYSIGGNGITDDTMNDFINEDYVSDFFV